MSNKYVYASDDIKCPNCKQCTPYITHESKYYTKYHCGLCDHDWKVDCRADDFDEEEFDGLFCPMCSQKNTVLTSYRASKYSWKCNDCKHTWIEAGGDDENNLLKLEGYDILQGPNGRWYPYGLRGKVRWEHTFSTAQEAWEFCSENYETYKEWRAKFKRKPHWMDNKFSIK